MNTLKIRFACLAVICIVTLFAQNVNAQQNQWRSWQDSIAYGEQLVSYSLQSTTLDNEGNAWALYEINDSARQFGVVKFDGNTWTHFPLERGVLYGIIRDSKGNLWVSGDSGISEFVNGVWQNYQIQDRFMGVRKYLTLAADSSGNIWVSCLSMVLKSMNGTVPIDTTVPEVYRFDGTNWTSFPVPVFFPEGWDGITSISVAPNGIVWAVGSFFADSNDSITNVLWKFDGQSWSAVTRLDNGLSKSNQYIITPGSIHADAKGGVWVAYKYAQDYTNNLKFYPASVNYFNGSEWDTSSLVGSRFTNVWLAPNGDRYFASSPTNSDTSRGGLVIANNGGIIDSIPKNDIPYFPNHVDFAANGSLWLSSNYDGVILETHSAPSGVPTSTNAQTIASAHPNPFRTSTNISYSLLEDGYVTISLFNSAGARVASLTSENESAGEHTRAFDGSNLMDGTYRAEIQSVGSDGSITRQSMGLSVIR